MLFERDDVYRRLHWPASPRWAPAKRKINEPMPIRPKFDPVLMTLVNNAAGQRVMLTTSGVVVTGLLVREDEWFRQQPALQHISDKAALVFPEEQSAHEYLEQRAGRHIEPEPAYIHLRDARYDTITETTAEQSIGLFWRGRLDRVSAWSVLSTPQTEEHAA